MNALARPENGLAQNGAGYPVNITGVESALLQGDLKSLTPDQRLSYVTKVCESLGLNPLTKPFEYVELDGKLVLYARKDCAEQLRATRRISLSIVNRERLEGVYIVTARATTPDGRTDESTGVVSLEKEGGTWETGQNGKRFFKKDGTIVPLTGDALANALMKAETKAKRRVTLSICGLGILDESELETIPNARVIETTGRQVDPSTGEIIESRGDRRAALPEGRTTDAVRGGETHATYGQAAMDRPRAAANTSAGQCPSCHAPAGKPHGKNCKAQQNGQASLSDDQDEDGMDRRACFALWGEWCGYQGHDKGNDDLRRSSWGDLVGRRVGSSSEFTPDEWSLLRAKLARLVSHEKEQIEAASGQDQ